MADVEWEVSLTTFEAIHEYAGQLENAEISQHDYLDRLRSLGMPTVPAGAHLHIVLRTRRGPAPLTSTTLAKLAGGVLPGLPN